MNRSLQVLLLGKDGRTDAIAAACLASDHPVEITAISPYLNTGLLSKCTRVIRGNLQSLDDLRKATREAKFDLAIIGPEEPLAAGAVDALQAIGVPCVGPSRALAKIETSKIWARELIEKYGISANPEHRIFRSSQGLMECFVELGSYVVKPDGLSGGKGVRVFGDHLSSHEEAFEYAMSLIEATGVVLIEERLDGEEFSLQTFTDGKTALHCPIVQDHKRAYEGDKGPNTGGMGSYSCPDGSLPFLLLSEVKAAHRINEAVIDAIRTETGSSYRGVLYGGFIATGKGLRLIEYNARLGDPEAMNVLPLIEGDFIDLCWSIVHESLDQVTVGFSPLATVCKYIVPYDYPERENNRDIAKISVDPLGSDGLHCFWAAAEDNGAEILLTGSRAVAFVGTGTTLEEAERRAESGLATVTGNVRHRRDIGTAAAVAQRTEHMRNVRESA